MFFDTKARMQNKHDGGLKYNPFKALVAPRPIGWVSTLSESGVLNLAPYSYFQALGDQPDIVVFSATPEFTKDFKFGEGRKDSEQNAVHSGEFVCNIVSEELAEAMSQTSASIPSDQSEAEVAGIEMIASTYVNVPRVARAPAAIECRTVTSMPVPTLAGDHRYTMVFGEVMGIHIDDRFIADDIVDTAAMRIVMRMGYNDYTVTDNSFTLLRPDGDLLKSKVIAD